MRLQEVLLRVAGDTSDASRELGALSGQLRAFGSSKGEAELDLKGAGEVLAKLATAEAALERFDHRSVSAEASIDAHNAEAELARIRKRVFEIRAEFRKPLTAEIRVKRKEELLNLSRSLASISSTFAPSTRSMSDAFGDVYRTLKGLAPFLSGLAIVIGTTLVSAFLALGATAVSAIGGIIAAVTALVAALGPVAAVVGALVARFKAIGEALQTFKQAKEAAKEIDGTASAAQKAASAFDDLTASERRFFLTLIGAGEFLRGVFRPATDAVFQGLTDGLSYAAAAVKPLQPAFTELGGAIGGVARLLGQMLIDPQVQEQLKGLTRAAADLVRESGPMLVGLFRLMLNVAEAVLPQVVAGFNAVGNALGEVASRGEFMGRFGGLLDTMMQSLGAVIRFVFALADAFRTAIVAAAPFGNELLDWISKGVQAFAEWGRSDAGRARIREFFVATIPLVKILITGMVQLGAVLLAAFQLVAPFLAGFKLAMLALVGTIKQVVEALNQIPPQVTQIIGVVAGLSVLGRLFGAMSGALRALTATGFLAWVTQSKVALVAMYTVLGALTARLALLAGAWAVGKIVAFVAAIRTAIVAMRSLTVATAATGWGALIVLLGAVAGAIYGFTQRTDEGAGAQERYQQALDGTRSALDAYRAAADSTKDANLAHEGAALSLRAAQQNLKNVTAQGSDAMKDQAQAAEQVADAQRGVQDALRGQKEAYAAVRQAAVAAMREIKDAAEAASDALRNVQQAKLSVAQARLNLDQAKADLKAFREEAGLTGDEFDRLFKKVSESGADPAALAKLMKNIRKAGGSGLDAQQQRDLRQLVLDERGARLGLKEAIDGESDARREANRAQAESNRLQREGIRGVDSYQQALKAAADSDRAVADARRNLTRATQRGAEAHKASALEIEQAEHAVKVARRELKRTTDELRKAESRRNEDSDKALDVHAAQIRTLASEAQYWSKQARFFKRAAEAEKELNGETDRYRELMALANPLQAKSAQTTQNLKNRVNELRGSTVKGRDKLNAYRIIMDELRGSTDDDTTATRNLERKVRGLIGHERKVLKLKDAFVILGDAIKDAAKAFDFKWIKELVLHPPGGGGGGDPEGAAGGVTKGATRMIIGEAGQEALIPLKASVLRQLGAAISASMPAPALSAVATPAAVASVSGGDQHFHVHAPPAATPDPVAATAKIARAMKSRGRG